MLYTALFFRVRIHLLLSPECSQIESNGDDGLDVEANLVVLMFYVKQLLHDLEESVAYFPTCAFLPHSLSYSTHSLSTQFDHCGVAPHSGDADKG